MAQKLKWATGTHITLWLFLAWCVTGIWKPSR